VRASLLCFAATILLAFDSGAVSFQGWVFSHLRLTSSQRSFSWKLFIASHCRRSLCHSISSCLASCLLSFFRLISSHLISCLLSSFLFSVDHNSSHLFQRMARMRCRVARVPWKFTRTLRARQAGLHGYQRNSHGSFDLDKDPL